MKYKSLVRVSLFCLVLSVLSSFVFASGVTPSVVVQYNIKSSGSGSFTINSDSPSDSATTSSASSDRVSFTSATVTVNNASTTSFELSPVSSSFTASTSTQGYSVTYSVSSGVATVIVTADSSRSSNICGLDLSSSAFVTGLSKTVSASGYSYTVSSTPDPEPDDPYQSPTANMNGIKGYRGAVSTAGQWRTYNDYIGAWEIIMDTTIKGEAGATITGSSTSDFISADVMAGIGYNGWSWKVDATTGALVFSSGAPVGSWLDMIFRYLTYDYYWGSRLWSGDVSGSWYGSISDSFSYLNYRVNQILQVLANDQDVEIKDATSSERDWVKNYFNGSGDKADADKYDKLNNTGSAFKDLFSGAPDTSISDGFTAVNDNGYDFWSQSVSNDINGVSSGGGASRAPAYVPPEQRIVDAYSENWTQIVGGSYD